MNNILFILPSYRYGGTMTSFKNLLLLVHSDYNISVKAIVNEDDAYGFIGKYANVLDKRKPQSQTIQGDVYGQPKKRVIAKLGKDFLSKIGIDLAPMMLKRMANRLDCSNYDAVIGFQEGYATYFVSQTNAKVKIAWIHSIYSRLIGLESKTNIKSYNNIDKIVCVSNTAKNDFIRTDPSQKSKLHMVMNGLDVNQVKNQSECKIPEKRHDSIDVISVGRIDPIKRFSKIPSITDEIRKKGLNITWHIVGGIADTKEYELLQSEIKKYHLEESVILAGQYPNPYPYIKRSRLLGCLSSSETFNYTLAEARTLGVPVVTTDFPAAQEFVDNGVNGFITPIEQIGNVIFDLLSHPNKYQAAKESISHYEYNNAIVKEQFKSLLNNV